MSIDYARLLARFPDELSVDDLEALGFIESGFQVLKSMERKDIPNFYIRFPKVAVFEWMKKNGYIDD